MKHDYPNSKKRKDICTDIDVVQEEITVETSLDTQMCSDGEENNFIPGVSVDDTIEVLNEENIKTTPCLPHSDHTYFSVPGSTPVLKCDLCEEKSEAIKIMKNKIRLLETQISSIQPGYNSIITNDASVLFYTGLMSKAMFDLLLEFILPKIEKMHYWRGPKHSKTIQAGISPKKKKGPKRKLTPENEPILTLMKLRLGLLNEHLAKMFGISESTVSSVFTTWVKVLNMALRKSINLPPAENILANLPKCFSRQKQRVRAIMDCTEFFIDRPKDLRMQALTWSDYKKHNTIKVLVVITPRGRIGFISESWGGRTSDRHITLNSGFMDLVEPYDIYMADRGFDIQGDLQLKRAELVIPPGARGKESMSSADVHKTKVVANLRIHVERAIERIKRFHRLQNTLPLTLLPLADDIICACAGLCNFYSNLVK